jgi:hypothetical protein
MDYRITDKHVIFWGSKFSNFYPAKLVVDKIEYSSSEQYFMGQKALHFGDKETFEKILKAKTPKEAKVLGRQVKGYVDEEWAKVRYDVMKKAVYEKFSQNEDLLEFILSVKFDDKKFVEGSPIDGVWGIRIDWQNPEADDESKWNGLNLLGKVIDDVRAELLSELEEVEVDADLSEDETDKETEKIETTETQEEGKDKESA